MTGPRAPLSRAKILRAALDLADSRGVTSVSMRSVAGSLGVEGMSLYHHVPNKKALMDGLVDLVIQAAELPTGKVTAADWLRGTALGLRTLARDHPKLVPLLGIRSIPLADAESALPFEAGLAAFIDAGYDLGGAFTALQSATVALLSMAQLEAAASEDAADDEGSQVQTLDSHDFPLLHQVAGLDLDIGGFWEVLVEGLVAGIATPR